MASDCRKYLRPTMRMASPVSSRPFLPALPAIWRTSARPSHCLSVPTKCSLNRQQRSCNPPMPEAASDLAYQHQVVGYHSAYHCFHGGERNCLYEYKSCMEKAEYLGASDEHAMGTHQVIGLSSQHIHPSRQNAG